MRERAGWGGGVLLLPYRLKEQFAPLRPVWYGVGTQVVPAWKGVCAETTGSSLKRKGRQ